MARDRRSRRPPPPGGPPAAAQDAPPPPAGWRPALASAAVFALVIGSALAVKRWAADVYFIPTGSMETTLYGRSDGGDRIACLKLPLRWRRPARWEITVFRFPIEHAARGRARKSGRSLQEELRDLRENRDQNYIKRVVGLPGETLVLWRGGVWRTDPDAAADGGAPWMERLVKPPATQRGMWLPVYRADMGRLSPRALAAWWRPAGAPPAPDAAQPALAPGDPAWGAWTPVRGGGLLATPTAGEAGAVLEFMPRVPDGEGRMPRLEAVADRYMVRQAAQLLCRPDRRHPAGDPDGPAGCGQRFAVTAADTALAGHCPRCGAYVMEDSAVYYHRRSSLPVHGPLGKAGNAVKPHGKAAAPDGGPRQREEALRGSGYHGTASLRVVARARFPSGPEAADSRAVLTLADNGHEVSLVAPRERPAYLAHGPEPLSPGAGRTELAAGAPAAGAGAWRTLELHRADGRIRVLVDGKILLDAADGAVPARLPAPAGDGAPDGWPDEVRRSGVRLAAAGGPVEWGEVRVDRDVHYYAGDPREHPQLDRGASHPRAGRWGSVTLGPDEYWAMGDNPPSSFDSRGWGPVPARDLGGTALAIWWPPHRVGLLNRRAGP